MSGMVPNGQSGSMTTFLSAFDQELTTQLSVRGLDNEYYFDGGASVIIAATSPVEVDLTVVLTANGGTANSNEEGTLTLLVDGDNGLREDGAIDGSSIDNMIGSGAMID